MSTLIEELEQAAKDTEELEKEWAGSYARALRARAERLRVRIAYIIKLDHEWLSQVQETGSESAALALYAHSCITGPMILPD